jgi:hypothetical protein
MTCARIRVIDDAVVLNYLVATVIVLVSTACTSNKKLTPQDSTTFPRGRPLDSMRQVLGAIVHFGDGPEIGIPRSGRVGQAVPVMVTTYGGGCIREDTTVIAVDSLTADISPYQRIPADPGNETCTAELNVNRRLLLVTFSVPGRATIKVNGRAVPCDSVVALRRTVLIR